MADPVSNLKTPLKPETSSAGQEAGGNFGAEISSLRTEIANLRELLAEKTGRIAERAGEAASYVQSEATSVAGTIREHPAATTTLFTVIGAIGFAIGYVVATASAESKQAWYRRYLNDRF